jgi:hypothetical protein
MPPNLFITSPNHFIFAKATWKFQVLFISHQNNLIFISLRFDMLNGTLEFISNN